MVRGGYTGSIRVGRPPHLNSNPGEVSKVSAHSIWKEKEYEAAPAAHGNAHERASPLKVTQDVASFVAAANQARERKRAQVYRTAVLFGRYKV